jgi:hypothetical protein
MHIGHKETSITVSTLPSAARLARSLDAPMTEVKLTKNVAVATALRYCAATLVRWRDTMATSGPMNRGHIVSVG